MINEGKYGGITRQIVKDIISVYKYQKDGEFSLPEVLGGSEEYEFTNLSQGLSVDLILTLDDSVEYTDVDAEYVDDNETMYVYIRTNPMFKYSVELLQDLIQDLNEVIRHELEHVKQHSQGYDFPKEPKSHEKYYTQQHELDAQRAGFKRRSKIEKKPMEYLVRKWFEKNKSKFKMTPSQVERVIQKILED